MGSGHGPHCLQSMPTFPQSRLNPSSALPLLLAHTVAHCLPHAPTSSTVRRNLEPHHRRPSPAQPGPRHLPHTHPRFWNARPPTRTPARSTGPAPFPHSRGLSEALEVRTTQRGHRATATLLCSLHCRLNTATSRGSTDRNTGSQEISAGDPRVRNFSSNKEMRNLRPRKVRRFTQDHTTK